MKQADSPTTLSAMDIVEPKDRTILVVDDDADILMVVEILMSISGFKVVTANDGFEALEQVKKEVPDLIVLDISMPKVDGLEVLRMVRANEQSAQVPVILLTALSSEAEMKKGLEAGATEFIGKPFDSLSFVNLVHKLLPSS